MYRRAPCGEHVAIKNSLCKLVAFIPINDALTSIPCSGEETDERNPLRRFRFKNRLKGCALAVYAVKVKRLCNADFNFLILIIGQDIPGIVIAGAVVINMKLIKIALSPFAVKLQIIK
jgi:hypothetical protein